MRCVLVRLHPKQRVKAKETMWYDSKRCLGPPRTIPGPDLVRMKNGGHDSVSIPLARTAVCSQGR